MMTYEARACCICGPDVPSQHGVSPREPAEHLAFEVLRKQWSGFFKDKESSKSFFSYLRCARCGLLFCPTYFSEQQLNSLYENMLDNTASVDLSALTKTQYGYFKMLAPYLQNLQGDYFEMGPDIGLFTKYAVDARKFDKIWLAEPNKAVWSELKHAMGSQTHALFSDTLAEDPIPPQALSAAVMIHVLDHMLDPLQVLTHLYEKMKKSAVLMIVTHDESSILAKLLKHRWPAYCLQHPQLYQPSSMTQLLEKAGFKILTIQKTYNYFPMGYLLNHLVWALGWKKKVFPPLNGIQLPLKLGNMMTIAVKPE